MFGPPNDVLVNGRKVSGSAQMRKWGVVLQHGTVLVDADTERMFRALRVPQEKRLRHSASDPRLRVTTLKEQLGRLPGMEEVKSALKKAFEQAFGADILPGRLTAAEEETARRLVRERYGSDGWNLRGRS